MATGPKLPETPLELLENDGTRVPPIINKFWGPGIVGIVGFTSSLWANYATKKPYMSGIQRHVLVTIGCMVIGKVVDDWRTQYFAERDAVLRHYVQLHPEDFPPFERKKFADVLEPWIPIRS